jgi:hypothetical protein
MKKTRGRKSRVRVPLRTAKFTERPLCYNYWQAKKNVLSIQTVKIICLKIFILEYYQVSMACVNSVIPPVYGSMVNKHNPQLLTS